MLNYSTRDAMTTKEEDLCVDSRDSNRTCLHVDLVRDCRKRRGRRRQTEEEREREREKKLSIRTSDPSKAVEVEFSLSLYHSNCLLLLFLNLSVRQFVRPLCHFVFVLHKRDYWRLS